MRELTVVFDLDGTLVDTAPDLVGATNHALADLGLAPVGAAHLRPWISFGARRMIVEALAVSHQSVSDPAVDRLLSVFLAYYEANIARESRPFPGAIAAVEALRTAGARLAICTNKRESLSRALLHELGLTHYFSALAGRDTFDVCKPHPGHLLGTIQRAGGNPSRAVMVGDSEVDVATAKAAGIPVIAVSFGYTQVTLADLSPEYLIDHYDGLLPALASLASSSKSLPTSGI